MKEAEVSALIGKIYDCAMAPEDWPVVLVDICDYAESAAGTLAVPNW